MALMTCVQVTEHGGADKLSVAEVPIPSPAAGEVLVRLSASGVNFIDIYFRSGLYHADLPAVLGSEGAGTVERIGPDVTSFAPGDRVAYAMVRGSYAQYAVVPARLLVKLPDAVDFVTAAAAMLQGMTAHYLTHSTYPLKAGETCLVHAAAGGTGGLIVQMARAIGARVIGTASTDAKAAIARESGAHDVVLSRHADIAAEVKRLTDGAGVDVVYDSVGKATFEASLDCLRRRGMLVLFGQSSGTVPPFDPGRLNAKGSLFLTRPSLAHYVQTPDELRWRTDELFDAIRSGSVRIRLQGTYPLAEAARAQTLLEGRHTTGKLVLSIN